MSERPTNDPRMTCAEVEEALDAFVGAGLDAAEEGRLARHLTGCPACAATAALAERVEVELAALPAYDAPPELIARIKAKARERTAPVVPIDSRRIAGPAAWPKRLAAAAALVGGLAIGWWQLSRDPGPSAAEIAAAEREARYALALVARIGRRATTEVRDEVFVERVAVPVLRTMNRQFGGGEAKRGGQKS